MKRTALFLKEDQLKKLKRLSEKTGAPLAELSGVRLTSIF